jgi:hypothetical protein
VITSIIAAAPAFAGFAAATVMIMPAVLSPSPRRNRTAWTGVVTAAVIYSAGLLVAVLVHQWPMAACYASILGALALMWWLDQRKRKRKAAQSLGYKTRARIADLLAALKDSLRHRPVAVPGGA